MFTLLVGCPPFWHRKQMIMLRNIMEGKYTFTSPEWQDISEDPKDLIRKCLVVDPEQRITAIDALQHPFFNTIVSRARFCILILRQQFADLFRESAKIYYSFLGCLCLLGDSQMICYLDQILIRVKVIIRRHLSRYKFSVCC